MCGCVLVCTRWGGCQCECPSVHGITHALAVCVCFAFECVVFLGYDLLVLSYLVVGAFVDGQTTVDASEFLGRIPPPSKLLHSKGDGLKRGSRHRPKHPAQRSRSASPSEPEGGSEDEGHVREGGGEDVLPISLAAVRPPRQGPVRVVDLSAAHALGSSALARAAGTALHEEGAWIPPLQACLAELDSGPLSLYVRVS